jgi:hypothetical protein
MRIALVGMKMRTKKNFLRNSRRKDLHAASMQREPDLGYMSKLGNSAHGKRETF